MWPRCSTWRIGEPETWSQSDGRAPNGSGAEEDGFWETGKEGTGQVVWSRWGAVGEGAGEGGGSWGEWGTG